MANIPGIAGCIFPHSDKPQEQTLSPVLPGYKCIPISSPPFWSLHKPKSLHQGTEAGTRVLAYAHAHGLQLHMYLDDWLLNPNFYQESRARHFG